MELVAVSTFVLVAVLAWFIFPRHKNLPPGPHPFPIIGNLHQLGKNPHWGKAVNIGEAIFTAMVNLMFATLFSTEDASFDSNNESSSDDQELLKTTIEGIANIMGRPNFADFFPILKPFDLQGLIGCPGFTWGSCFCLLRVLSIRDWNRENHARPSRRRLIFRRRFLIYNTTNVTTTYDFSINVIKHFLMDLFVAGLEPTACTLEWVMTELLLNTEVLFKTKQEMMYVAGENENLNESDVMGLPYLKAVIKEALRHESRNTMHIAHVSGYFITKETQLVFNVWEIGRDPGI
ncbi:PREDICTED: ferruginol synthase-like [Erythranthe guttata]|uniref:ferruginol synthase-like n=1 Tax=Erythranthe guttata TaxID=4155 RepID=UPI00064DE030|nr:PREDICTED: ferruginol synthase-like [Erythranthe guttata]|eukprot:XP_012847399.1 PREDICTED: ferruginol synthase-like [Erythranthe guttata]